jgi:hypothetical protein
MSVRAAAATRRKTAVPIRRFRAIPAVITAATFIAASLIAAIHSPSLAKDKPPPEVPRYAAWKEVESFTAEASATDHWWHYGSQLGVWEDTASVVSLSYRFDLKLGRAPASNAKSLTWSVQNCQAAGEEDYHSRGGEFRPRGRKTNIWHKGPIDGPTTRGGNLRMDLDTGEWTVVSEGLMEKPFRELGHYHVEEDRNAWRIDDLAIDQTENRIPGILVAGKLSAATRPGVLTGTQVIDKRTPGGIATGSVRTYRVVMWPNYRDVECVVEIQKYDQWLPAANLAMPNLPGSRLSVKATLKPKDGGPKLALRANRFRFELSDTSHEPGVAMNYPRLSPRGDTPPPDDPNPDIKLALNGVPGEFLSEGQRALIKPVPDEELGHDWAQVFVDAYDFGGYANLQVVCELNDGREIPGILRSADGAAATADITLPKRSNGSKIADSWRSKYKLGPNDADDLDPDPVGDGNGGDGFSNYEEYRGFIVNGRHRRTDPTVKDIFILNKIGPAAQFGLFLFRDATGLAAHYNCLDAEMPPSRIMNLNRSARSPRSSQELQHGLVLVYKAGGDASSASAAAGLFRPKNVERVYILKSLAASDKGKSQLSQSQEQELASTIAHELCHAIGVDHHGETDLHHVAWVRAERKVDGRTESWFEERESTWNDARQRYDVSSVPGDQIRIFDGPGVEILASDPSFPTPQTVYVGVYGGEHSGSDRCLMRYDCANAYILPDFPRRRYLSPGEPCGLELCESKAGVGINDPKANPPRYGDASAGDCKHQFAVRDDAPDRRKPR